MAVDLGTSDISCIKDFVSDGRVVTGRLVVAEAIARRLWTPRGRLIDDPNYGLDVPGYINQDMSSQDVAALQVLIEQECRKDERVVSAAVVLALATNGIATLTIDLTTSAGPFKLTLAVGETTYSVLSVLNT